MRRLLTLFRELDELRGDLDHLARKVRAAILLIRTLNKTMVDIKSDIDTLTTAETALETKVAADASEIAGLKAQIVPGVVLTDDQAAAIHALADRYAALAGLTTTAPAADPAPVEAAPTEAPTPDAAPSA